MKSTGYFIICAFLSFLTLNASAQKTVYVFSGELTCNSPEKIDSMETDLSDMLGKAVSVKIDNMAPKYIDDNLDRQIVLSANKLSFNVVKKHRYTLDFADLKEVKVLEYSFLGKTYEVELPGLAIFWKVKDLEFAKRFANDIVYFQNIKNMESVIDKRDFEAVAAKYRSLREKPQMPEEARKFIVQANAMTQAKNYTKAIELYKKAIQVDPAIPMVYNNQALLFAMISEYNKAISSMKKYLILLPDAEDARSAQDKIYEWEAMISK